jgi:hypothetical protein
VPSTTAATKRAAAQRWRWAAFENEANADTNANDNVNTNTIIDVDVNGGDDVDIDGFESPGEDQYVNYPDSNDVLEGGDGGDTDTNSGGGTSKNWDYDGDTGFWKSAPTTTTEMDTVTANNSTTAAVTTVTATNNSTAAAGVSSDVAAEDDFDKNDHENDVDRGNDIKNDGDDDAVLKGSDDNAETILSEAATVAAAASAPWFGHLPLQISPSLFATSTIAKLGSDADRVYMTRLKSAIVDAVVAGRVQGGVGYVGARTHNNDESDDRNDKIDADTVGEKGVGVGVSDHDSGGGDGGDDGSDDDFGTRDDDGDAVASEWPLGRGGRRYAVRLL